MRDVAFKRTNTFFNSFAAAEYLFDFAHTSYFALLHRHTCRFDHVLRCLIASLFSVNGKEKNHMLSWELSLLPLFPFPSHDSRALYIPYFCFKHPTPKTIIHNFILCKQNAQPIYMEIFHFVIIYSIMNNIS